MPTAALVEATNPVLTSSAGAVSDGSVVKVNKVKGSSVIHRLSASCSDLGEQEVSLTVGNQPTKTNGYPATRSASIRYTCEVV